MKPRRSRPAGSTSLKVLLALLLLLAGISSGWLPETRTQMLGRNASIPVVGNLSRQDLAEIRRLAQREKWRGILPQFTWPSIRMLPAMIRHRASMRIVGVQENADATVTVYLIDKAQNPDPVGLECTFSLECTFKKHQKGWLIIKSGWMLMWGCG